MNRNEILSGKGGDIIKTAEQYAKEFKEANGDESKIRKLFATFLSEGDTGKIKKDSTQELYKVLDEREEEWKKVSSLIHGMMKPNEFSILLRMIPSVHLGWTQWKLKNRQNN